MLKTQCVLSVYQVFYEKKKKKKKKKKKLCLRLVTKKAWTTLSVHQVVYESLYLIIIL